MRARRLLVDAGEVAPGRVERELAGDVELQPDAGAERWVAADACDL